MPDYPLTPEDLIAGASVVYDVPIPPEILRPGGENGHTTANMIVQLRPLTIGTFQLIMKASRQDATLIPLLMIKEALVQPKLTLEQVKQLHLGFVNHLLTHIRAISGLSEKKSP
jgi:hypothetical protein